ncbi:transposase, IS605 OrfB family, central region [Mariprofundus ferrinatatus]|uniref:Transposase, IS605 OrfB family, central region n=1 Tax=Mariprofundus ferrinatatus TaxID=1921087 RepID=A0A2K8L391_9PROT|nr:RNA-guided endonuclease TnpB family protein [Mariprofundus ferrinatatus]ATX81798.1 transposase, IS605 OrfB family, central region [Mariprofundus ferrinatatus]
MMRTASIKLDVTAEQSASLRDLQSAYVDACNKLVPVASDHRCWNRVALHALAYTLLRSTTPLGSQMVCNAIYSVCKAYKAQKELGRIRKDKPVPIIGFKKSSIHFDKRTYTIKGDMVSLYTLGGRISVPMIMGQHQHEMLRSGMPKEAELICRKGKWYFNLVVEKEDTEKLTSGPVVGVDVGENNLAATSIGKVYGGGDLRHRRDKHLALRRRLQSNGSRSAKQKLRQVSGKEQRRVKHINHETSKSIVQEAQKTGASKITMEDLNHIRDNIKAGKRVRTRLHRWAFRQLQTFIQYKAEAVGITVEFVNPAYTSQTCSACGSLGNRDRHRFECLCGLRAHADLNASRNLARIGSGIPLSKAFVNTPDVPSGIDA